MARCREAMGERVMGDTRVEAGVFSGETVRTLLEKEQDKLWEKEGHNLVVTASGLNDVLRGNEASIWKQITKGVKDLRATSHDVQIVVCMVQED